MPPTPRVRRFELYEGSATTAGKDPAVLPVSRVSLPADNRLVVTFFIEFAGADGAYSVEYALLGPGAHREVTIGRDQLHATDRNRLYQTNQTIQLRIATPGPHEFRLYVNGALLDRTMLTVSPPSETRGTEC